jgi:hypothetical protein
MRYEKEKEVFRLLSARLSSAGVYSEAWGGAARSDQPFYHLALNAIQASSWLTARTNAY